MKAQGRKGARSGHTLGRAYTPPQHIGQPASPSTAQQNEQLPRDSVYGPGSRGRSATVHGTEQDWAYRLARCCASGPDNGARDGRVGDDGEQRRASDMSERQGQRGDEGTPFTAAVAPAVKKRQGVGLTDIAYIRVSLCGRLVPACQSRAWLHQGLMFIWLPNGFEEPAMKQRVLISAGFVVNIVGVILIGQLVFLLQRMAPTVYSMPVTLPAASDLMNGVDKSVGMMFSLTLGLFVLAGFVLRGMEQPRRVSPFSVVTSACFLAVSIFSIYMGFMARNVALYYASFPSELSISTSGTFIVLQALGVAGAGLCAILLLADFFLNPHSGAGKPTTKL